ncbi:MAG: hypothetical protein LBN74_04255 [Prevotella sp.]|jgi:hypothetical protein|nr:hypothetical protein [Prevotella sp.]
MQTSEFRFWSVKRTEAQIKENMYGIAPNTPGLEVYWRCNEGSGKDIIDASGHGRDAVIGTATSTPKWNLNQSVEVGKQN